MAGDVEWVRVRPLAPMRMRYLGVCVQVTPDGDAIEVDPNLAAALVDATLAEPAEKGGSAGVRELARKLPELETKG